MASQDVQIAKTAFQASLLRADPTNLTRQQIDPFFPLLESTITRCDRTNVQNCKNWVVAHVVRSKARTAALGRYLAALSKSFKAEATEKPSSRRRRLHLLYVVSDVLHHVHRDGDTGFASSWNASLPSLVASAASFDKSPKHHGKLQDLVRIWEERGILQPQLLAQLQGALSGSTTVSTDQADHSATSSLKLEKEAPFILPALHGDPDTPWYDQPAGTWLPHLIPGDPRPMRPSDIKPIPQTPGPAPQPLVDAVKKVLADADRIYNKNRPHEDDPLVDRNELGERIYLDEVTGEVIGGDTYYGWSRDFCEKMKARIREAKQQEEEEEEEARGRARSRSLSRSVTSSRSNSSPLPRRQRESSRDRSYSRDYSSSRSRRPSKRRRYHTSSKSNSRSRSRRQSRDRSSTTRGSRRGTRSLSKSRSASGSRPSSQHSGNNPPRRSDGNLTATGQAPHTLKTNDPIPPPPTGPMGTPDPMPFPRPSDYRGPWPPPPFPVPPMGSNTSIPQGADPIAFMQQMLGMNGQQPPPPPPPPPPPSQPGYHQGQGLGFNQGSGYGYNHGHNQNQGYGRGQGHSSYGRGGRGGAAGSGGNTYRGRGRGGYDQGGWR